MHKSGADTNTISFGVALYALLSGLILIVMRKRVFAHLVGFLVIENGVFLFSMAIGVELPMLINLAIMLDILISIFVLGMFLQRMDNDMNTDESDALTSIKD
jgi:hydrogenase-4 component E